MKVAAITIAGFQPWPLNFDFGSVVAATKYSFGRPFL